MRCSVRMSGEKVYRYSVSAGFSALLSFSITAGNRVVFCGSVQGRTGENYFQKFVWYDLIIFLACFVLIFFVLNGIETLKQRVAVRDIHEEQRMPVKERRVWIVCGVLIFLAWLPYLLALAPGSVLEDSLNSVAQIIDPEVPLNNHHPVMYTFLVGVFIRIGLAVGNINAGVFLYSLFQAAVMIATVSYVPVIMYRRRFPGWVTVVTMLWYMFMPFFPDYAVIMWKDPLFSCALLWLGFLLLELADDRTLIRERNWLVRFLAAGLAAAFFRNNGIYVVIISVAAAGILCRRQLKRFLAAVLALLAVYYGVTGGIYDRAGIETEFVESLGIPLQQMAAVVANGGEFSDQDEEFLYRLLPEEEWRNSYAPCLVDSIKWNPQFDAGYLEENKGEFFRVWFSGLIRNFPEYVKAYGMETLGFWMPGIQNDYGYIDTYISENGYGIYSVDLLERFAGITSVGEWIREFRIYVGSGTLLWLIMTAVTLTLMEKSRYWIVSLPALGNWLTTMIAAPVAFSFRYVYIFALGLPLFLILPFLGKKAETKEGD